MPSAETKSGCPRLAIRARDGRGESSGRRGGLPQAQSGQRIGRPGFRCEGIGRWCPGVRVSRPGRCPPGLDAARVSSSFTARALSPRTGRFATLGASPGFTPARCGRWGLAAGCRQVELEEFQERLVSSDGTAAQRPLVHPAVLQLQAESQLIVAGRGWRAGSSGCSTAAKQEGQRLQEFDGYSSSISSSKRGASSSGTACGPPRRGPVRGDGVPPCRAFGDPNGAGRRGPESGGYPSGPGFLQVGGCP